MRKVSVLALVVMVCCTANAEAIEIKNVRATYGPFGAPRQSKMLPGDVCMINFDIAGLAIDAKTGLGKYEIGLEVFDPKGKAVFKENQKKPVVVPLGGTTVPEFAQVMLGVDLAPGMYKAIVTIVEVDTKASAKVTHDVELLPRDFGFIHVQAPSVGFVGQDYTLQFSLVDMGRDSAKMPKVTVTVRVLDANGKPTLGEPSVSKYPDDLPAEMRPNVAKQELAPLGSPMFLNRAGTFTVEVEARDELKKKTSNFKYDLKVIDPAK